MILLTWRLLSLKILSTIVLNLKAIIDFVFGLDIGPYGVFDVAKSIFVPYAGHVF